MKCKKVKNLFFLYLENELKDSERVALEKHLKICNKCNNEFKIIKSFYSSLEIEEVEPEPFLDIAIKNMISKNKESLIIKILKNFLYPATVTAGILTGLLLADNIKNQKDYEKALSMLKINTFVVDTIVDINNMEENIEK